MRRPSNPSHSNIVQGDSENVQFISMNCRAGGCTAEEARRADGKIQKQDCPLIQSSILSSADTMMAVPERGSFSNRDNHNDRPILCWPHELFCDERRYGVQRLWQHNGSSPVHWPQPLVLALPWSALGKWTGSPRARSRRCTVLRTLLGREHLRSDSRECPAGPSNLLVKSAVPGPRFRAEASNPSGGRICDQVNT